LMLAMAARAAADPPQPAPPATESTPAAPADPGEAPHAVSGRVIDAHGRGVAGARVAVEGSAIAARTDRDGRYRLAGVADGASLVIEAPGLQTGLATVAGAEVDDVVLRSEAEATETIEVHGEPPPSTPGATTIERGEAERIPGTGGDLVRTLTAMPGVLNQPLPTGPAGVVIRGSAPQDSKILIDGFEVPLLYHTIALRAILPVEAIDSLDYIPGGFDVSYGRAASGIIALKTRAGGDRRSEQAEISVLDGGVLVQGPADAHTTYMVAFRRSTIDLVLPYLIPSSVNLSLTTVPNYYDLQARIDRELSSRWTVSLSTIGSIDTAELFADKMQSADKRFFIQTEFVRVTGSARWHDGPWSAVLALSEMPQGFDFERGAAQHAKIQQLSSAARGELTGTARGVAGLSDLTWRLGGEANVTRSDLDLAIPTPPHNGVKMVMGQGTSDPNDTSTAFAGVVWTPDFGAWTELTAGLDPRIHLTAGLRVDGFARTGDVAVQPRGQLQVKLSDATTARLAAGAYRRPGEYQDELLHDLRPERATQVIAGLEHQVRDGFRVQTSLYYTDRSHLITSDAQGVLGNQGRGTTYGAELLATLRDGPWFGWLSYSYSHSTRVDYPGAPEQLFQYDQPHSLNAAASWRHGAWQLGARFELYSGTPYTPVVGSTYDSDSNVYTPSYGPANSQRTPIHHQLDLRVDHTWQVGRMALTGFIDVQNVYLNDTITSYSYNYDYSQSYAFTGLPIIPSLGLRGVL
ncbi:MAG TPA: TonB-dependent receptor, partial [Kofleriaceae bacterium]|nr:TonB-dependent receptor [Kofleriaceae bacterium]